MLEIMVVGGLVKQNALVFQGKKKNRIISLTPQANPHFLDLIMMTRGIFFYFGQLWDGVLETWEWFEGRK